MPPKPKKQKEILDERFQAVVLTDSFETRFMPLTADTPRCLLPLCSVPLIEYTLEFLAQTGVNEVFLLCLSHADKIQAYIEASKWTRRGSPFMVSTVVGPDMRSVGDAMRDLDGRGLITGDFILVSGDVVTNVDFSKVMAAHKLRKAQDKDHIVTMVLSQLLPTHRTRSPIDPDCFVLDKTTNRCLYYSPIPRSSSACSAITIDTELLEDVDDEFVVRNDLIDCRIDICSPHVPQIFQENFDYQTLRSDFVKGVLSSDLLKKTIYAHVLEDGSEYAARVESWATYDAVSQDILARWCYPLAPDANLLGNTHYHYEANHIYKEKNVVLAQSCKIGSRTSIGADTHVGEGLCISNSVVGRNVRIGANVVLSNAYVWDNAVIGDGASVTRAVVARDARVGAHTVVNEGAVVSFGVAIGADMVIGANTRLVSHEIAHDDGFGEDSDDEFKGVSERGYDHDVVGADGVGFVYNTDYSDSDSESEGARPSNSGMLHQLQTLNLSDTSIASVTDQKIKKHRRARRASASLVVSTDYEYTDDDFEEEDFNKEAIATVERSLDNNHDLDTALLELNTLRMSMNVTYHEVRLATVQALFKKIVDFVATDTLDAKEATTKIFRQWGKMFQRQVFSAEEQVDLLGILQTQAALLDLEYGHMVLFLAIRVLYELDILEEEQILEWWELDAESERLQHVRLLTAQFVAWLREAEEESEEE